LRIRRLHAHYVDAVNRRAWDEFDDLFLSDAELEVARHSAPSEFAAGPGDIGRLIGGFLTKYDFLIQVILNARVMVGYEGGLDRAFGRLYIAEYRQLTAGGRRIESSGSYHDIYRKVGGRWWFARRRYDRIFATAPKELEVHAAPSELPFLDGFRR
jgi:hypothetical protein